MKKLTGQEAIEFVESGAWKAFSLEERGWFQLLQGDRLCLPFDVMQSGVEAVLNRPVQTIEFMNMQALLDEALGEVPAPSFEEVIAKIPPEKRIVILKENKPCTEP